MIEKLPYILFYLFGGLFIVIATWENFLPRRKYSAPFLRRWCVNGFLLIANTAAIRWLLPVTTVIFAARIEQNNWGLLHFLSIPLWVNVLIAFVLLDLYRYWAHRAFHQVPVLWRLHRVHHADSDYDLTTGLRFHPGEALILGAVNLLLIVGIGVAPLAVAFIEAGVLFNSLFTHGNAKMPDWLDQSLRTVIVTPDMHRVHHSIDLIEANQNFASIFSFWDRMFGSYTEQPALGHTGMSIGLPDVEQEDSLSLWNLLYMPFGRQPDTGS